MTDGTVNDEFGSLGEVAAELGLKQAAIKPVARHSVEVGGHQQVSGLVWGETEPELVFLHGGGQVAHTWDLVLTALGRPAIAIDLPGHGHSAWREDRDYGPVTNALAVAQVISELAPAAAGVVGMSLGGLTLIRLGATRPELVRRAVIVDVTPGSTAAHARMSRTERGTTQLISEYRSFASLDEMAELAVQASPGGRLRPSAAASGTTLASSRTGPGPGVMTRRSARHRAATEHSGTTSRS